MEASLTAEGGTEGGTEKRSSGLFPGLPGPEHPVEGGHRGLAMWEATWEESRGPAEKGEAAGGGSLRRLWRNEHACWQGKGKR